MRLLAEIEDLSIDLERFHSIFYQIWSITQFEESDKIPTAGVLWDKYQIRCMINPKFWNTLNRESKLFLICHEMLHLILRHPQRTKAKNLNKTLANVAQDICINEMLSRSFGFDRDDLNFAGDKGCWLDNVKFTGAVMSDREFEYYYNRLDRSNEQKFDDHSGWEKLNADDLSKILERAFGDLEVEELEDLKIKLGEALAINKEAGTETLDKVIKVKAKQRLSNRWQKIFKHWSLPDEAEGDNWTRKNRRMTMLSQTDFMLPAEHEREAIKKGYVWLFLDTSGSCMNLAQDFFDAAKTIPKKWFNVRLFGFHTKVYEVKNNDLRGFGGTSFSCIENFLRQQPSYPRAVFVITDGYGDQVTPSHPERWYWFLSDQGGKHYIPKGSKTFAIKDLKPI